MVFDSLWILYEKKMSLMSYGVLVKRHGKCGNG